MIRRSVQPTRPNAIRYPKSVWEYARQHSMRPVTLDIGGRTYQVPLPKRLVSLLEFFFLRLASHHIAEFEEFEHGRYDRYMERRQATEDFLNREPEPPEDQFTTGSPREQNSESFHRSTWAEDHFGHVGQI